MLPISTRGDALKARFEHSDDLFERALTSFVKNICSSARPSFEQDLELARKAGVDDSLMLKIVAHVALHALTN